MGTLPMVCITFLNIRICPKSLDAVVVLGGWGGGGDMRCHNLELDEVCYPEPPKIIDFELKYLFDDFEDGKADSYIFDFEYRITYSESDYDGLDLESNTRCETSLTQKHTKSNMVIYLYLY